MITVISDNWRQHKIDVGYVVDQQRRVMDEG